MPSAITSAYRRVAGAVGALNVGQRTIAIILAAAVVLGAVALGSWLLRPTYTPLFSGLAAADASAVVDQLRAANVPYELVNGGATILVPEQHVDAQRLAAAAEGLPGDDSAGYSLIDTMGVTTSEFQQSVTYKRALEGELASTIASIAGVESASVKLAIPKDTIFVSERRNPTASVFVRTRRGATLSTENVSAIINLTSASIDGMSPDDVAVIDAEGVVLSAVGTGVAGGPDQRTTDLEARVQFAVQQMLDRIVGPGNATVAVAATISSESAERVTETFEQPVEGLALDESSTTESYTGTGGGAAGVLGPDNIAVPNSGVGTGSYESTQEVRNNAVNRVTESRSIPAGAVDRQTVSVAVNSAADITVTAAEISSLVAAAAGIEVARGDEVAVEFVDFSTAAADEAAGALRAAEAAAEAERMAEYVRLGLIALAVLLPLILITVLVGRRSRQSREPVDIGGLDVLAMPMSEPAAISTDERPALTEMDARRAEISRLASTDPGKTAEFLRAMMDEQVTVR